MDNKQTFPNTEKLESQDTIHEGQYADLRFESDEVRIWLNRGDDAQAEVEVLLGGWWHDAGTYDPNQPPTCTAGPDVSLTVHGIPKAWLS